MRILPRDIPIGLKGGPESGCWLIRPGYFSRSMLLSPRARKVSAEMMLTLRFLLSTMTGHSKSLRMAVMMAVLWKILVLGSTLWFAHCTYSLVEKSAVGELSVVREAGEAGGEGAGRVGLTSVIADRLGLQVGASSDLGRVG